ncbi:MAG: sterol desaturase family protein [Flavobacterium sp.]|uniref:sterol desaturase family protein n=1 Tax=Flavobacterium sp. TaxID=239 RepID=UPI001227D39F|nr:sterol desaturase family protein [Flavobacterium sp.]RZJ65924.1 MAG: sterol desaturase family protein [Flavobacterium sp.]
MSFVYLLIATGASLFFLALVFIPMEKAFPAKPGQKVFRKNWLLDFGYFLGQYLFWSGIVLAVLSYFSNWLNAWMPIGFREALSGQPFVLQAIEILFLSDLIIYWGHRLQHKVDFLWRFHKVHHSAETLDWLASHREHPLDSVYTIGLINLPAFVFGFDLNAIAMLVAFRGIWAIYIHSNVRLNIGFLKMFIGSPDLHHWHHDRERDRGNYANISPLMDLLFGTYVSPNKEPEHFGINENFPQVYWKQLAYPLLPAKWTRKLEARSVPKEASSREAIVSRP